ncbi:MAG: alginate lyase family protein [Acidimicrobiia bacterium]|nr:alginate lyase family protein [Acidimicrobiia bacterium]
MSIRGVIPLLVVAMIGVTIMVAQPDSAGAINPYRSIWLTQGELEALPMSGPAWNAVVSEAEGGFERPNISDNTSDHDTQTFAAALVAARTGNSSMRQKTVDAINSAIGTEDGGNTLSLSRNLVAYVLAADLIDLPSASPSVDARFRDWLNSVRRKNLDGRTLISTHEDRPNNWGTHAGASRMAAALYLGDATDFSKAARTFKGLLGDRSAYSGFRYGDLDWQSDPNRPVGINPPGSTINGHSVDGVLPDDQRRGGDFTWPPPCENYVREAMQGMVVQAEILRRQGQDAFQWSDRALLRAANWLTGTAGCEFEGDDEWMTPLLNAAYGTSFPVDTPVRSGKHLGFTDWTHGESSSGTRQAVVTTTTTAPATTTTTQATSTDPTDAPVTETTALRVAVSTSTTSTGVNDDTTEAATSSSACTIVGTEGPDVLIGTNGDDVICGLGGDDRIEAGRGNDIVFAGAGNDTVYGDRGRDILNGEDGNDYIDGGRSNDYIDGGPDDDTLYGGSARDTIVGGGGDDYIHAGSGDDIAMGGDGNDTMLGEDGDDFLDGGAGTNRVDGGDDDDMCAMSGGSRAGTC